LHGMMYCCIHNAVHVIQKSSRRAPDSLSSRCSVSLWSCNLYTCWSQLFFIMGSRSKSVSLFQITDLTIYNPDISSVICGMVIAP